MTTQETDPHRKKINANPLDMALRYLSHQPRSIREIHEYLTKKMFDEDIVLETIEMLVEKAYLNDEAFTRSFVESRMNHKPKSIFALAYELHKKGIDPAIVESVLNEYDDQALALKAIKPKIKLWAHLDGEEFRKKALNFLHYRGFRHNISISILNTLAQSEREGKG